MCHVTYIFFEIFLRYGIIAKSHHYRICVTDFREGDLFGSPPSAVSAKCSSNWMTYGALKSIFGYHV